MALYPRSIFTCSVTVCGVSVLPDARHSPGSRKTVQTVKNYGGSPFFYGFERRSIFSAEGSFGQGSSGKSPKMSSRGLVAWGHPKIRNRKSLAIFKNLSVPTLYCRTPPTTHHPHKRPSSSGGLFGGWCANCRNLRERQNTHHPPILQSRC